MQDRTAGDSDAPHARRNLVLISVVVPLVLFVLVSQGGTSLFDETLMGLVFNAMGESLLQGRFDIAPEVIGLEAFLLNGKSYAYFGVFPALLRLPLMLFPGLTGVNFSRLFLWIALSIGALAQIATVRAAFRPVTPGPVNRMVSQRLMIAAVLAGPAVWLSKVGSVYDEAAAWAWALASVFCALAVHQMTRPQSFTTRPLAAMAVAAGCCLLTRPTSGFGLSVSLGLLLLWLIFGRQGGAGLFRRMLAARILVPAATLLVFAALVLTVNYYRWGNPFVIGDVRLQTLLLDIYPGRIERLERFGYFHVARLGYGLLYYFLPVWVIPWGDGFLFERRIRTVFDAFELPPASFFITDALTMVFTVSGVASLIRGQLAGIARAPALALLAGLSFTPVLMLMAWYMAFRYRLDFVPLIFTLGCLGGAAWAQQASHHSNGSLRRTELVLATLLLVQCVSSLFAAALLARGAYGPAHDHIGGGVADFYLRMFGFQ